MEFPILNDNIPKFYKDEVLFLRQNDTRFTIDKKSYNGVIYLSSLRLVFVSSEYSFDIPLANITEELFSQPIFAPNNLSGCVKMITGEQFTKKWKIQFYNSVNTFLNIFTLSLFNMRKYLDVYENKNSDVQTPASAFMDPNNSSVLYISFM